VKARQQEDISLKLADIKVILLDVDGVLTDGRINLGTDGFEYKSYDARDGHRIKLARRVDLKVVLITGRKSESVRLRGKELGVDGIFQGILDKTAVLADIVELTGSTPEEMIYMGDDMVDLPLMRLVGLSACPEDAAREVLEEADITISRPGGRGAVGSLIEDLLKAKGKWEEVTSKYFK
jgi:3-deoxy-D-manno-octulosonate 8-phosphate phosphatase (KDO 8-P phosphatase)